MISVTTFEHLWWSLYRVCIAYLGPRSRRHEYRYEFRFTKECFANIATIFHYIVNNFTNCTLQAVNNSTLA